MEFFRFSNYKFSHFLRSLLVTALLFCAGAAWGSTYVYTTNALYLYTGTLTDYEEIVAAVESGTDCETSTAYDFTSGSTITIESEDTLIISSSVTGLTLGSLVNNGIFINYGIVTFAYGFTNNSTGIIENYRTFTSAGPSTNNGTFINTNGATFAFVSGMSLSNNASLINSGSITALDATHHYISNYGTITNSGSLTGTITNENGGTVTENYTVTSYEATFKWNDEYDNGNWSKPSNWLQLANLSNGSQGYVAAERYPDSSGDEVYFTGNEEVTVTVSSDISVGTIYVHSESSSSDLSFNIDSNAVLSCDVLFKKFRGSDNYNHPSTVNIYGNGKLSCKSFQTSGKISLSDDSARYFFTIDGTLEITEDFTGFDGEGEISVIFDGSGTLYIPASGERMGNQEYGYSEAAFNTDDITVLPYGQPEDFYYYIADYAFSDTDFRVTLTRSSEDSYDVHYKIEVTDFYGTDTSFKYYDHITQEFVNLPADAETFGVGSSKTRETFVVAAGLTYSSGDYITIKIYTPDGRFVLGEFTYPQIEVTDFHTYYWTGDGDGSTWSKSANWAYKDSTRKLYISVAKYDDGAYDGYYPGYDDNDTAVFQGTDEYGTTGICCREENYNLTILCTNTSDRTSIAECGTNAESANITLLGSKTLIFNNCKFASVLVDETVKLRLIHTTGNYSLETTGDFTVNEGATVWGNTGAILIVGGNLLLSGSISDNASGKISKLTVAGETLVNSAASISLSEANMTFTGNTEIDGTFQTTSGTITFTGDTEINGTFSASNATTYFINSNADFSKCTSFTHNSGTIYFYNQKNDSSKSYTFKTPESASEFYKLEFTGESHFVLNSDTSVNTFLVKDEKNLLTESFTVDIESDSSTSRSLSITGSGNALEIYRGDGTAIPDDKTGTLKIGENVSVTISDSVYMHSGTVLKNEGICTFTNLSVVTASGISNPKLSNSGTVTGITKIDVTEIENSDTGSILTNSGSISATSITSSGIIETSSGSISAETVTVTSELTSITTKGILLNAGTLKVTGSGESKISELYVSGGTVTHSGSGTLTVTYLGVKNAVNPHTFSNEGGTFYFADFSATRLGGNTISFSGSLNSTENGTIHLSGTDSNSLLNITGSSGIINITSPQNAEYLSVSKNVTVGTAPSPWNGTQPTNSISAYNSKIAESGVSQIYGWKFVNELYWSGSTSTVFSLKSNWLTYGLVKRGFGRWATYSYQYTTASSAPTSSTIAHIAPTCPASGTDGSSTQTVTNFPKLTTAASILGLDLAEDATLTLNGNDFTVSSDYSNLGTIYLSGTETVTFGTAFTDEGTWSFSGGGGSGTVKPVENLSYSDGTNSYNFKNLLVTGNANISSVSAESLSIGSSSAVTLTSVLQTGETETNISGAGGIILKSDAIFNANGNEVIFASPISGNDYVFTVYDSNSTGSGRFNFSGSEISVKEFDIGKSATSATNIKLNFTEDFSVSSPVLLYTEAKISGSTDKTLTFTKSISSDSGSMLSFAPTEADFSVNFALTDGEAISAPVDFSPDSSVSVNVLRGFECESVTFSSGETIFKKTASESYSFESLTVSNGAKLTANNGEEIKIIIKSSWTDNSTASGGGFNAYDSTVQFADLTGTSAALTGNTSFYNLLAEDLGGKTLVFDGNFTVSGALTLQGSSVASLLSIETASSPTTSTSPSQINLSQAQHSGKYLSISKVTIGEEEAGWDGKTLPDLYYASSLSAPKIESDGTYEIPYGWLIEMTFKWAGTTSTDWDTKANWLYFDEAAESSGSPAIYSDEAKMLPNEYSTVIIPYVSTYLTHLSSDVEVKALEIRSDSDSALGKLYLDGHSLTVSEEFSNSGTVYLCGTETVTFGKEFTDEGTWSFFGGGDGSGILAPITNLKFNNVSVEGDGILTSFEAEAFSILPSGSTGPHLTVGTSAGETVRISAPTTLSTTATLNLNKSIIDFKNEISDSSDLSTSSNILILSATTATGAYDEIIFEDIVSCHIRVSGNIDFSSADFEQNSEANFTVGENSSSLGDALFGTNKAVFGNLIVNDGSTFTQKGINTSAQSVTSIQNEGAIAWDFDSEGGTLTLNGSISGTKAGETVFNKKNVTIGDDAELSGVFYDLTVESGKTVTNGSGITIRRNFTLNGEYSDNSQVLRLGEITISVSGESKTFTSEDGSFSGDNESANLGNLIITQNKTVKKFESPLSISSLTLSDTTEGAGAVIFNEKAVISSITNDSGTGFGIAFNKGADFTSGATFNTSGNLSLGGDFTSDADFFVTSDTILSSDVNFLAADKNLTFTGSVSGNYNFVAKADPIFKSDVSISSIDISGITTINSLATGTTITVSTTSTQSYTGNVNLKSSAIFKAEASDSTRSQLTFTSMTGDSGANCEIYGSTVNFLAGDYVLSESLTAQGSEKILFCEGVSGNLSASGGFDFSSTDVYFETGSSVLTLSSVMSAKNLYLFEGELSLASSARVKASDFAAFGPNYSADDLRYSGSDTRFAYFSLSSLAYLPLGTDGTFKKSEIISAAQGSSIELSGNFYVNGLDLSNISLLLPDLSSSNPIFNESSDVTENQWGTPYAVVFNSEISSCSASASSGKAFVTAAKVQNVTDGTGNSGFTFNIPKISEAYSVSDSVICIKFDMDLENSNGEVSTSVALVSSLASGGIFYNSKGTGSLLAFDGLFYTESDGTFCTVPLSESDLASTDIPAGTALYLKAAKADNQWNTDASASSSGNSDSSDRSGIHRTITTDLSLFEGLFFSADGKTMSKNYGSGLWKDEDTDGAYSASGIFETIDKARPVLIDVFVGQELFSENSGSADSQKPYDSHNFIEFRYSEPVDIGDLAGGATENNQNIRSDDNFDSASSHGGAILNNETGGITILGFASIEKGQVTAGIRNGDSHTIDTALPHSLYRKFARNTSESESVQPCRVRLAIAGYVDEDNPVSYSGSTYNNWIGYIDSSTTPSALVTPLENSFITDCARDSDGNALKNIFDETNSSRTISVNEASPSGSVDSSTSLYGEWDTLPPVFAPYIDSTNYRWTDEDNEERTYEIVGTVDSNTSAYLERVEMHIFDNKQNYSSTDTYKWVSQIGWTEGSASLSNHSAPESSGGSRSFTDDSRMTQGGIRRSSLSGAYSAFVYKYSVDGSSSSEREFATAEVSQNVKSPLFRNENLTVTSTENDGLYLAFTLNDLDNTLPIRTSFVLTYSPDKSFITDLAGNRLIQTDSGKSTKTIRSVDITPPSFSIVLSPIGEDKIYAVFTKPLAYQGTYLSELSNLDEVLEKIRGSLEFVYSNGDNIDSATEVSGDDEISVTKVELAAYSADYTALLFTLNRKITLDDVEKIWLRINDTGDTVETFSGETIASYFQDSTGNSIPFHTCHAISDFAVNAVNVLYAYSESDEDENWNEQGVYGDGLNALSSDFAVHDFSADGGNYAKLRTGHDIVFQLQFVGGKDDNDEYFAPINNESLSLVIDKKSNISSEWISDKFNLLTGNDWRIWIDTYMNSLANGYNSSPTQLSDNFEDIEDSEILKNMTLSNEKFNFANKDTYQFFFKILDSNGEVIELNHDGDTTTPKIPLYSFWMPEANIKSQKFSFLDLWSFSLSDITKQRGGVSILNNVINASVGEKTAIEVEMKSSGNLNVYIMTLDGNIVKRLSKGTVSAGTHFFYWDGKNNAGKSVARGLYFVRVSASGIDETRKVMVVK
ncbi:MAG: hypothetical protein IJ630_11245 [Treponema sp.]|nr:hypothetical protein [Treponema sp.]